MLSSITGTWHRGKEACATLKTLPLDTELKLVREPENGFDKNACAVIYVNEGVEVHLGYIPKLDNPFLAKALDAGKQYKAIFKGGKDILIEEEKTMEQVADNVHKDSVLDMWLS